jgi:hypothetical protein
MTLNLDLSDFFLTRYATRTHPVSPKFGNNIALFITIDWLHKYLARSAVRPKYGVAQYSGFTPRLDAQVKSATSMYSTVARNSVLAQCAVLFGGSCGYATASPYTLVRYQR